MNPVDDNETRALLRPLAGEPGGTQRLDMDAIVRDGDRRRRHRALGTGLLTAVVLLGAAGGTTAVIANGRQGDGGLPAGYVSASPGSDDFAPLRAAPPGPDCTAAIRPGPAGPARAVDHTGHYLLRESGRGSRRTATVWKDDVQVSRVEIPSPRDGEYSINARGEFTVIWAEARDKPTTYGRVYSGGKLSRLKGGGTPTAIADDGTVLGSVKDHDALWERPDADPEKLASPSGTTTQVMFLDQDGTTVGYDDGAATIWLSGGGTRPLPMAEGEQHASLSGIASGWIAGYDSRQGFRYQVATEQYEVLPAQILHTQGVAGNGTVVGDGTDGNLYVYDGKSAFKLPRTPGNVTYGILGISDDGRTVTANEYDPAPSADPARATGRVVTWTCG